MNEMRSFDPLSAPIKLRVEDYLLLDDSGAYESIGNTELIEGEVFPVNSEYRPHLRIKSRLFLLIATILDVVAPDLEAGVEGSVSMPPINVPMPDIVVTSEIEGEGLVPVSSVRLIVEVADATLRSDLTRKSTIYARHGVPEYWVVDVNRRIIHQLAAPADGGYAERGEVGFGDTIRSVAIPGLAIDTTAL